MDGTALQRRASTQAQKLPHAEVTHPFGPDWDVFKVHGKVFMLLTGVTGEPIVVLKSAPSDGKALQDAYADITPGYHMNKRHWITLSPGNSLTPELVDDVVTESYLLVVEKLPTTQRPVDPKTFGRSDRSGA